MQIAKIASRDRDSKQSQLEALNATLEQSVRNRTAELEHAVEELRNAKEAMVRSETLAGLGGLVAGVSHEMSTPIGNALLMASTLQQRAKELESLEPSEQAEGTRKFAKSAILSTDIIRRNLERMEHLVTNFRSVSVDQTSMRKRTFDLSEVIRQVQATLAPSIEDKRIKLLCEFEDGIQMLSYPGAVEHVVINLVNNAIKHAFSGNTANEPVIRIQTRRTPKGAELLVSDNGRGMGEDERKHAFDLFFTTTMGQGGAGIGLALVHRMVTEVLSGNVDIQSRPGEGVLVTLRLPLEAKKAP